MILIKHIDAIAREQARDVLYLEFHLDQGVARSHYRFEDDVARDTLLDWLDAEGIAWQACACFADETRMESYRGQVWLDVAYDESAPHYRTLINALEHPDGSMKHSWVRFMVMPLRLAMRNAHHDAPGFWTRWAEQF